jgi:phosphoglycolate phosphatase
VKHFIFDFDGTLVDSFEDIAKCLLHAYKSCEIPLIASIDRSMIGAPLLNIIKKLTPGISDEDQAIVLKRFRELYDHEQFTHSKLFEGILPKLHFFFKQNIQMFIATLKPKVATYRILEKLKIKSIFSEIVTPDHESGCDKTSMVYYLLQKWRLNKDETCLIGDSIGDIIAAHENSIMAAVVGWGYGDLSELQTLRPKTLINCPEELYNLLDYKTRSSADESRDF